MIETDALWISRDGELACIHYVPHPPVEAGDTGTWRQLTRDEADEIEAELDAAACCWTCDRIEQRAEWEASRA